MFTLVGREEAQGLSFAGLYQVRLCLNGKIHDVRIDDYFPCKFNGRSVYIGTHGDDLWPMLIEKAYAKVYSNYDALRAGLCHEALSDLSGAPVFHWDLEDERGQAELSGDKLWQRLISIDYYNNLVVVGTTGEDKWIAPRKAKSLGGPGLVAAHSYALLLAVTLSSGARIALIRNPWEEIQWSGPYARLFSLIIVSVSRLIKC